MAELFSNLVTVSTTAGTINNTDNPVTFSLTTGQGANFPALTTGNQFRITVSNLDGSNAEVMVCTARSGDSLTCTRGSLAGSVWSETPAPTKLSHSAGSLVSQNITTGAFITQLQQNVPIIAPSGNNTFPNYNNFTKTDPDSLSTWTSGNLGPVSLFTPSGSPNVVTVTTPVTIPYTKNLGIRIISSFSPTSSGIGYSGVCVTDGTKLELFAISSLTGNVNIFYYPTNTGGGSAVTLLSKAPLLTWGYPYLNLCIQNNGVNRIWSICDMYSRIVVDVLFQEASNANLTETAVGTFNIGTSNNQLVELAAFS